MDRRALLAVTVTATAAQSQLPGTGIIGLGRRSGEHLKALAQSPDTRVVALCDLASDRIAKANAQAGGQAAAYTDYRELLANKAVSTVVIIAPNYLHHEMVLAALRAGKDVLVEKPIALTYQQARELEREARRLNRILAVGMQRRYFPMDAAIAQAVASGLCGSVRLIQAGDFRGDWSPLSWHYPDPATGARTNWRYLRKTAGSAELELSIHTLAMIHGLVRSPIARVYASGGTVHYQGRETRDLSSATIDFRNGVRASYSLCLFAPSAGNTFSLLGSEASLLSQGGELLLNGKPWQAPGPLPTLDAEVYLYRDFFESVRTRKPSALDPGFAIEASKIAWAIDRSIEERRPMDARDFPA